jgi:16S rRNA processing protein RimM
VRVFPLTDSESRFSVGSRMFLDGKALRVTSARSSKGTLIVRFYEVPDRNAADAARGHYLTVAEADCEPLPEGSYYHFQLLDTQVWSDEGEYLGILKEILATGATDVYLVSDVKGNEILIPAASDFILNIDLENSRMTVKVPQYI